jgi:hypothetical protein
MKLWQFTEPVHWHGKGFSIDWNFPGAWLVLIHFDNGERKAWYRRTERAYRFRRWFFKKGKDRFQNIANFKKPEVCLFVFKGFSPFPEKIRLPMDVRLLRVREPEALIQRPQAVTFSNAVKIARPSIKAEMPDVKVRIPAVQLRPSITKSIHSVSERLNRDFQSYKKQETSSR